jgi:hypothetical protein
MNSATLHHNAVFYSHFDTLRGRILHGNVALLYGKIDSKSLTHIYF